MYLSKRSNGVYYLWYRDELERKQKISTKTTHKAEALQFLSEFKRNQQERKQKLQRVSLSEFTRDYLTHCSSKHTRKTLKDSSVALRGLLRVAGDLPLHKIGVREIDSYLSMKTSEASQWTARKHYAHLASAFETARKWKCIPANPFRQVEKPKVPEIQPAHFTKLNFQQLLSVIADQDFREVCIFAVSTGLRLGELVALQWRDVDFVRKVIVVQNSETFTTKSKRIRVVPMNEQLWRTSAVRKESATCALVFHHNNEKLNADWVSKTFKRYVRTAKLSERLHFHSLRHTFATWLVQSGVGIYEVQKLLGHSSVAVTQIYAHLAPSELHNAVEKISLSLN